MFSILSFLSDWQQRVVYNNSFFGEWKDVNKGMTQESVNVFLNDLNIQLEGVDILFKYVDDTNIVIPLWKDGVDQSPEVMGNFLRWSEKNSMSCNPGKSKELTMRKKGFVEELCKIHNLPQCSELKLIECIHMTSLRPYWCPKTMERRPCWCPKPILWELNFFLIQTLSFVAINLHRCWSRE